MARTTADPRQFTVTVGDYTVRCTPDGLPALYPTLTEHAILVEEYDLDCRDTWGSGAGHATGT